MPRFATIALTLLLFGYAPQASAQLSATACVDGFAAAFPCASVDLMGQLSLAEMNGSYANDIWGWTDELDGKEYALVGLSDGTSFVDVSVPTDPVFLGKLPGRGSASTWRDIKVYANHAFVVSEANGHGMQVFDLTQLRGVTTPQTFSETAHYNNVGRVHNVAINEDTGFAYIVGAGGGSGCAGGLHMVNIQDPVNPTFAGCFDDDGYTHDVQCVTYDGPDTDYANAEICFASNEDTVTIVDVTDKGNPTMLSQAIYPNDAYTHQGWLTEDHRYFIANDEIDEQTFGFNTRTLIFDVQDLNSPEFSRQYNHPTASTDHNSYVKGNYAFQSNYTSGLRIVDLTRLLDTGGPVREIAFFDTFPSSDNVGFGGGSWSNYPYFESGIVIVSDQGGGLFVVDPQLPGGNPVAGEEEAVATSSGISAAYPNPTTSTTQIDIKLDAAEEVEIVVYDVLGRRVVDLFDGTIAAGEAQTFSFDASALPAGLYFIRANGDTFAETRQVSVTR